MKESDIFSEVKELITKLTTEEKKLVVKLIQLQGVKVGTVEALYKFSAEEELVYHVLSKRLKVPPLNLLSTRDSKLLTQFTNNLVEILLRIGKVSNVVITKTTKVAFYHSVIKLVFNYLQNRNIPISVRTVLTANAKIMGLLEAAHPGYVMSSFFLDLVILRQSTQKER